jgi:hypothetical protein
MDTGDICWHWLVHNFLCLGSVGDMAL